MWRVSATMAGAGSLPPWPCCPNAASCRALGVLFPVHFELRSRVGNRVILTFVYFVLWIDFRSPRPLDDTLPYTLRSTLTRPAPGPAHASPKPSRRGWCEFPASWTAGGRAGQARLSPATCKEHAVIASHPVVRRWTLESLDTPATKAWSATRCARG